MTFSFTVLGSSAAIPVRERHLSAHLLNADERLFLIDCGEGTQFQLRHYHISYRRIHQILVSHLHGDHFFGLIGLINSMHLLGRTDELQVFGPDGLEEILGIQLDASQTKLLYPLTFHPLPPVPGMIYENKKITIDSFPVKHSIPAYGFTFREKKPPRRIPSARSFGYCGDTAFDPKIAQEVQGVSLLYHEATFMNNMAEVAESKFHSTTIQAATIALKANARKLVIGHFSARYEDLELLLSEARTVFPSTFLAEEGKIIQID